jgi:hypothetical protein
VALQYEQPHSHVNRKPGRKKQQVDRCSWSEPEKWRSAARSHRTPDECFGDDGPGSRQEGPSRRDCRRKSQMPVVQRPVPWASAAAVSKTPPASSAGANVVHLDIFVSSPSMTGLATSLLW